MNFSKIIKDYKFLIIILIVIFIYFNYKKSNKVIVKKTKN